ncbi:MAG: hypothetical protein RR750_22900, partial [Citrobacter sp.]
GKYVSCWFLEKVQYLRRQGAISAPDHPGFAPHTLTVKSDIFSHVEHVIRLAGNKRYKALATAQKPLGARAQKIGARFISP